MVRVYTCAPFSFVETLIQSAHVSSVLVDLRPLVGPGGGVTSDWTPCPPPLPQNFRKNPPFLFPSVTLTNRRFISRLMWCSVGWTWRSVRLDLKLLRDNGSTEPGFIWTEPVMSEKDDEPSGTSHIPGKQLRNLELVLGLIGISLLLGFHLLLLLLCDDTGPSLSCRVCGPQEWWTPPCSVSSCPSVPSPSSLLQDHGLSSVRRRRLTDLYLIFPTIPHEKP